MPQTFSLVEIGPSNDHSADFVRCFYNYVFAFEKAFSAVQSSEERLENFTFRLSFNLLRVA